MNRARPSKKTGRVAQLLKRIPARASLRIQHIRCGNRRCKTCPHGPYWYAEWRGNDRRTQSVYIGSELPASLNNRRRWRR
jgi:hypothetical protein